MSRWVCERPGRWRLASVDGENIEIARSEHSDWLTVPLSEVELLLGDIAKLAQLVRQAPDEAVTHS